jgi:hypothetical protein
MSDKEKSDTQKFKKGGTPKPKSSKPSFSLPKTVGSVGVARASAIKAATDKRKPKAQKEDKKKSIIHHGPGYLNSKITSSRTTGDNVDRQNRNNKDTNKKDKKKVKKKKLRYSTDNNEVTLPLPGSEPSFPSFADFSLPPLPPVRVPDRDNLISLVSPGSNEALLVSVLFEELSAVEIVKFARNDTIDGINPQYNVISNLAELKNKLDPSYLIAKQRSDTTIDNGFSINLSDKIPAIDYLFENNIPNYVHFDSSLGESGSLVIELENIDVDEIVEVEIDTSGTIIEVR